MEGQRKPNMERYTVLLTPPGAPTLRLLVPFTPESPVSHLATEVKRRISRLGLFPTASDFTLHLGNADGPLLDAEDTIEDVILDSKVEFITATASISNAEGGLQDTSVVDNRKSSDAQANDIQIRIITPILARAHESSHTIPPIRNRVKHTTTLKEVKDLIIKHLCIEASENTQEYQECNCSFGRQIQKRASIKDVALQDNTPRNDATPKFIVVHGNNIVQTLEAESYYKSALVDQVHTKLQLNGKAKQLVFIGGILTENSVDLYEALPVISVCSEYRHREVCTIDSSNESPQVTYLDMHTSEAPIELTTFNASLTISELGLLDIAVNDVLDIYVIERKFTPGKQLLAGKDGIFLDDDSWEHPVPQSERGVAMLLSTLRVISELINARQMDSQSQDAVLHLFNLLTRFPPAVRAIYIVMNGKSLRSSERAALSQSLYEILKDVVPVKLINSDPKRFMEGTRLLFGLVLEKVKSLKAKEDGMTPYLSSISVLDLRNQFTMENIFHVAQTSYGLVEYGYFEALKENGPIYWNTGEASLSLLSVERYIARLTLLCGGLVSELTYLDLNRLRSGTGYSLENASKVVSPRELSDLNHLAALCSRNKLSVLPPSALASASSPALTLDRNGNLAVYVGRAPCAEAGKDISIFRPTSGGEETIDVSIITQLLVPILEQRESEGTTIFDAFGDGIRKLSAPEEILMVVVDCSRSMALKSDFVELVADESNADIDSDLLTDQADSDIENTTQHASLSQLRDFLIEHDSIADMISIVREVSTSRRHRKAAKVLSIIRSLVSQQLSDHLSSLANFKKSYSNYTYRQHEARLRPDVEKLRGFLAGLDIHSISQGLCDFLVYRAANAPVLDKDWVWKTGDSVPKHTPIAFKSDALMPTYLTIPPELVCPISQELMEDPVTTSDGFTFERSNIERWFQMRKSSPLTGLVVSNTQVRSNGKIANQIRNWISGDDLIANYRPSRHPQMISVNFLSKLGQFTREIPKTFTVPDVYRLAFRCIRGSVAQFELYSQDLALDPNTSDALPSVSGSATLRINIPQSAPSTVSPDLPESSLNQSGTEELCLIKVYHGEQNAVLFSYWVPRQTKDTFASIIYKYWRFRSKDSSHYGTKNLFVWTNMTDQGDGFATGTCQHHWSQISGCLNEYSATGSLHPEPLWNTDHHLGDESDEEIDGPSNPTLILKVYLTGGPSKSKKESAGGNLSRLDVLKSMFDAFVNRLLAYNFQTHMGLIAFHSTAAVSQSITHAIENFRHKANDMTPEGDTALWDAIALAIDQIQDYAKKFPTAKKRILCLSDGEDNRSSQSCAGLSLSLMRDNIVVDSFCIGGADNIDLRALSYLSGGYKIHPKSLEQAMAICEMEPVLSLNERPDIVLPREAHSHLYDRQLRLAFARDNAAPEVVTADIFPQRKQHPNSGDSFVQLSYAVANTSNRIANTRTTSSTLRSTKILAEIRNIVANPHPYYDVYLSETNMSFWKVIMQGPPDSAYSTGTFALYIDMEEDFPAFPPKCRLITPIYHPNINRHGKVCHSILDRNWTSDTTILQLINTVYSLLLVPEFSDPINSVVTLNFLWDEVAFRDEAKAHIAKHATKTRAVWKAEILGEHDVDAMEA